MFAVNYLGPFLLTDLLTDSLKAGAPSRVLVVSAPSTVPLNFDDLQGENKFSAVNAFGATKTAGLLFTFELARILRGQGVTANAFHPGIVKSDLMRQAPVFMRGIIRLTGSTADKAGDDLVYLASSPEVAGVTGKFYKGREVIEPPAGALDENVQRKLWDAGMQLTSR
jgi:NAD(P)-dependent dehydrogenase (short-subunit alcohol dehydrogenase family)